MNESNPSTDRVWLGYDSVTPANLLSIKQAVPKVTTADLQIIEQRIARPSFVERPGYRFATLLAPHYNRATREMETLSLSVIITKSRLLTILPAADDHDLFDLQRLDAHTAPLRQSLRLAERIAEVCQNAINLLANDVEHLLEQRGGEGRFVLATETALARRNTEDLANLMRSLAVPIRRLARLAGPSAQHLLLALDTAQGRADALATEFRRGGSAAAPALRSGSLPGSAQKRLDRYMTFGAVILALTFAATNFGFGAKTAPLLERPVLFWAAASTLVLVSLGVLEYLRKRKVL